YSSCCCPQRINYGKLLKRARAEGFEIFLGDFEVSPIDAGQVGGVGAPALGGGVFEADIGGFLSLGFEQPVGAILGDGHEIRVVGAQVHRRVRVLDGEAEGDGQLGEGGDAGALAVQEAREIVLEIVIAG